jgi:hypothetical protein
VVAVRLPKVLEVADLKEDGVSGLEGGMSLDAQIDLRSPRSDGAGTERE